jgi:hypothetical protein
MTMYLPNPDLHPTGSEPGEFIDVRPLPVEPAGEAPDGDERDRWTATADHPRSREQPPGG